MTLQLTRPLRRNILDEFGREIDLDSRDDPRGYALTLNQPLFRGFQTINTVREAEANVLAARESLRNTEQTTLLNAVTAYMDVIQNQATVGLQKKQRGCSHGLSCIQRAAIQCGRIDGNRSCAIEGATRGLDGGP